MRVISASVGWVILLAAATFGQDANASRQSLLKASFSKLPIYFVENRGVYPDDVAYTVQGADKTLFFTKEGITFRLKGKDRPWVVKLTFEGANPEVRPRGEDRQQAVISYFKGPEEDWRTGLRTYAKVVYEDLWPGIDLVYRGTVHRLKYEFVVKPGADPGQIRLRYAGATSVKVLDSGALRVETPAEEFEDEPPVAWQDVEGTRRPVEVAFVPAAGVNATGEEFVFRVGDYDRTRSLVLDPALLVYCGYIGGAESDDAYGIAVDALGNAYVTGSTTSNEKSLPVKVGPDLTFNAAPGKRDAFVAKVNAAGTRLEYCGYIGGADNEMALDIAVDTAGRAYVVGLTYSTESTFPVRVGPDLTFNGGGVDAFVARINAAGTTLDYCGYIGGSNTDEGYSIAVDRHGAAVVAGNAWSDQNSFPVVVGPDLTHNGSSDVFVAKVNPRGSALVYCGYIGGALLDACGAIAMDASGNAYVAGMTRSDERSFPVKVGPDLTFNSSSVFWIDAFVAKVNASGKTLDYCGYIGGSEQDTCTGIAVDSFGCAYVVGATRSDEKSMPVRHGPDLTHNGGDDGFVAKVNARGTALSYCGFIGGSNNDGCRDVGVDRSGNVYVTGATSSPESSFPAVVGPDLTHNGFEDAFVAQIGPDGKRLVYCGYIGGTNSDYGNKIALGIAGNAWVAGMTNSLESSFPVKVGPDLTFNSAGSLFDTFVAKVALTLLEGPSAVQTGGTVAFALTASDDVGLLYQVASSFGTGPMSIDARKIHLSPDPVLYLSTWNAHPGMFVNYTGRISPHGQSTAFINLPKASALIGIRLHTAFVTLDPAAPSGVKSISNTSSFTVTQ